MVYLRAIIEKKYDEEGKIRISVQDQKDTDVRDTEVNKLVWDTCVEGEIIFIPVHATEETDFYYDGTGIFYIMKPDNNIGE